MTLSVRVPPRVEQELAEYCAKNKVSKSEAVNRALEEFLASKHGMPTPYELGRDLFGAHADEAPSEDVARHSKKLLRERFRGGSK
jgi:RHH-type rel operon transcriptional repressor/antitoxin RelB